MADESKTDQDKQIFELTDVYDERIGQGRRLTDGKNSQKIIVVEGRGYERIKSNSDCIHELTDIVEDHLSPAQVEEVVVKRAEEIIEKIARELIPGIAERVIREEIEKIKAASERRPSKQD